MKKLTLLAMAMFAILYANAQNLSVATLSHQGVTTHYYGSTALESALSAAAHGDTINLSGGTFEVNESITKGVVIRGAGAKADLPTSILWGTENYPEISVTNNNPYSLSIEGVRMGLSGNLPITGTNVLFMRTIFEGSNYIYIHGDAKNLQFVNCYIPNSIEASGDGGSVSFINSYVGSYNYSYYSCSATFVNSICNSYPDYFSSSTFINCILTYPYGGLPSTTTAINCVSYISSSMFNYCVGVNNQNIGISETLFKTYSSRNNYSENETFELTDEAKAAYLGNDGKEVGLYGGVIPFTWTPSYPQISALTVGERTNDDGLLEVNIEVSAGK